MEDERVGSVYRKNSGERLSGLRRSLFPRGLARSPILPLTAVLLVLAVPLTLWRMHRKGQFHTMKQEMKGGDSDLRPRPGGLDPILLSVTPGAATPNQPAFASAMILPGLGMSVLQVTANLPGQGKVPLFAAPSLDEIADGVTATPTGPNDDHGALELPWSGGLRGSLTPIGNSLNATWHGKTIEASTETSARPEVAEGGMLIAQSADSTSTKPFGDGAEAQAAFLGVNRDERWPSKTDVSVTVALTGQSLEITVDAKNTGDQPEPMGIGWHPRFRILSGNRGGVEMRLPPGEQMEWTASLPTGQSQTQALTLTRYQGSPAPLGPSAVDTSVVKLKPGIADRGAEFLDPKDGYGLRLLALSPTIQSVRAVAPEDALWVSLGLQTNMDDPFGKEWAAQDGASGLVTLQPGQTMQWKARLEIFSVPRR